MKNYICILFLLVFWFVLISNDSQAQWVPVNSPPVGAMSFCASDTSLIAGTGYGIYNSLDMGNTWSETLSGTKLEFVQAFVTTSAGSLGTNLFAGGLGGVYLSKNGGASWTAANKGLENKEVHSLAVSSDGTGEATTLFAGTTSGVFRSTDNGINWVASGLDNQDVLALTVIKDGAGRSIILAGIEPDGILTAVFRSSDNGLSWIPTSLSTYWVSCFAAWPNETGGTNIYAGTYNGVYQSTDNGINWIHLDAGPHWSVHSLAIIPNEAGGVNFFAGTFMSGVFLSADKGVSWNEANTGLKYENESIDALVVLGNYIFAGTSIGSGVVWKRSLLDAITLVTSVDNPSDEPLNLNLEQNYPNPFNPSTRINWQSQIAGHQTVKVYDVLGLEIATLIDEYKPAGRYETVFNATNLSSGTYFYQIKVGDFIQTKKMILVK